MRFLFRLVVLGLAAFGAKSLYDKFAPKAADLREPVSGVLDSAKEAARGVSETAKGAASQVVEDAKQRAADVRDQAQEVANAAASDDAPTAATSATASTSSGH
jgi:ElaB/YqjD/DUF883 family membrane-anchored ribosome-binding protein